MGAVGSHETTGVLGFDFEQKHLAVFMFFFLQKKQISNTAEFGDIYISKVFFLEVG